MKGEQKIIDTLNQLLGMELAAMDQYFVHSRMFEDWGLSRLHERIAHEMEDETGHASGLIERILFLEGTPDLSTRNGINIGKDVPEMLRNDLEVEYSVVEALRAAIAVCEDGRDYQTRELLQGMLRDTEEDHAYWLEKQLGLIEKVGLQNYLQSQM